MDISEQTGKFSSAQFEIEGDYEVGQEVVFQGNGAIVKEEHLDKQDGTKKKVLVIRQHNVVIRPTESL